jgi:hypothetical protein
MVSLISEFHERNHLKCKNQCHKRLEILDYLIGSVASGSPLGSETVLCQRSTYSTVPHRTSGDNRMRRGIETNACTTPLQ